MSKEISKTYDFKLNEPRQFQKWLDERLFHADADSPTPPFSMVIPPPNITGVLHMGHALNNTLQDILARWNRMKGKNVLWVPGTDHAGIATQNVVEKQLKNEKKRKEDIGREAFIRKVWEWKEHSGGTIIRQLKRLGCSCDWERERFTMDEGLSRAVEEVFVRLYQEELIYRSERLINWCVRCQTALSDVEVVHQESEGTLYYIQYPLADDPKKHVTIATTRPETLLGDTAVAVHPEDPRFQSYIGKALVLPFTGIKIPVIGDPSVEREFGSGAVKVTPGHDFNDYEMGIRHHLPIENIFTSDGKLMSSERTGPFAGLTIPAARKKITAQLTESGALVEVKKHLHSVGKCYRCQTTVEPYLSNQWFVKINPLAAPAIEAVRSGNIEFIPRSWENTYFSWMENIKDWCISRQLWWGHRIPVWYCLTCHPELKNGSPFHYRSLRAVVSVKIPLTCEKCKQKDFIQEPDVLDTWFSSALWPFSTLGWPEQTKELEVYYPTSVLVTAFDIIFFWVARMIMMGIKFMDRVPFKQVYIHALVRDAEGQKMSKSKGNVVDPLDIIDRYGTDAFRFTLAAMAAPGRDILLDEERIAGYRNFCNKIWNAARFIQMNLKAGTIIPIHPPNPDTLPDEWILLKLNQTIHQVNLSLEQFRFDEAAHLLYHFIWHDFCDWYLEFVKPLLWEEGAGSTRHTMIFTFKEILILIHPFMPFISEALWEDFSAEKKSLLTYPYPQYPSSHKINVFDETKASDKIRVRENTLIFMDILKEIIKGIRSIRGENNIPSSKELKALLVLNEESIAHLEKGLQSQTTYIVKLCKLSEFSITSSETSKPSYCATYAADSFRLYVDLTNISDPKDEIKRLKKQIEKINTDLSLILKKFENPNFVKNAPETVVKAEESRKKELESKVELLSKEVEKLKTFS
ncbi:MAG: valine--tRNA ligase [Nitrospirae bacterium]|nr:valine--tRNA ligase [Nitrospirota bacterium]